MSPQRAFRSPIAGSARPTAGSQTCTVLPRLFQKGTLGSAPHPPPTPHSGLEGSCLSTSCPRLPSAKPLNFYSSVGRQGNPRVLICVSLAPGGFEQVSTDVCTCRVPFGELPDGVAFSPLRICLRASSLPLVTETGEHRLLLTESRRAVTGTSCVHGRIGPRTATVFPGTAWRAWPVASEMQAWRPGGLGR